MLGFPYINLIWREPVLRKGAVVCVVLALIASGAEVAMALTLVPILVSLGVGTGSELPAGLEDIAPAAWLFLFGALAIVRSLANWQSSVQTDRYSQELIVGLQSRVYRALSSAHWDAVRRSDPPTITSALQTQAYDAAYGFDYFVQIVTAASLVIGYLISTAAMFPLMLPVLLALLAAMWALNARRNRRVLAHAERYVDTTTELHQRYEDWVAISRISSLGVNADTLAHRFESAARNSARHAIEYSRSAATTRASYEAAVVIGMLLGVPIAWSLETPPELLVFGLVAFIRVLPRASSIQNGYQGMVNAVAPVEAIESLAARLERDRAVCPSSRKRLGWRQLALAGIGVEDVVREGGPRWILRDVDLNLGYGEWLALTGPTGAGKTTLADVMLMLVRPDSGQIRIDGKLVDEALAGEWRHQSAYVPQDVVLFDASIRDNLRLYVPDATDAELEAALEQSAAQFVLTHLPEKLDTRAGPGGRWLSGGERHRIGIARALLKKPGFLVLDEPTAALDSDTQDRLMDALAGLKHAMSVVVITHRPELLRLADRIIGLEDGKTSRRDDGFRRNDPGPRRP